MICILLIDRRLSLLRNKMTRNYGMILSTILWINQVFDSALLSLRSWRFVWQEREKKLRKRAQNAPFCPYLLSASPPICALDQQNRATHLRVRHTKPPPTPAGFGLPKDIRLIEANHLKSFKFLSVFFLQNSSLVSYKILVLMSILLSLFRYLGGSAVFCFIKTNLFRHYFNVLIYLTEDT